MSAEEDCKSLHLVEENVLKLYVEINLTCILLTNLSHHFFEPLYYKATDIIIKCDSFFITKCDKSLLQNASRFLLQNGTIYYKT